VLENVKELWSEIPAGAGKKAKMVNRDRMISKLFLRGAAAGGAAAALFARH